jgi:hypothetical protein
MLTRFVLVLIALFLVANALFMLVAPTTWYYSIDSVPATGPLNTHFVRDIGCAYLAAGVGVLLGALRPAWLVPGGLTAVTFVGGHALIHLGESLAGHSHGAPSLLDSAGVYAPAAALLLILVAALRRPLPAARQENR